MASSLNKILLIGRLGKDPETTKAGTSEKVTFPLATEESWKDRNTGDQKKNVDWHRIVIWGPLGAVASKYLRKGDLCYLEGKSRTRSYVKDNVTHYITEVVVDELKLLGGKADGSTPAQGSTPAPISVPNTEVFAPLAPAGTDDLPF